MNDINLNDLNKTDGRKFDIPPVTLITLFILSAVFGALTSLSPLSVFGVLFIASAAACCAFASEITSSLWFMLAAPLSALLAALLTRSLSAAISAMAFLPCAAALIFSRRRKLERTPSILIISAALGICSLCYIAVDIYLSESALTLSAASSYYNSIIAELTDAFTAYGVTDDIVASMVEFLLMFSPSIVICMLTITGYLVCGAYTLICRIFRVEEKYLPRCPWPFKLSSVSAYIFIAAYVASILFSGENATALSVTAENLIVILVPPFMLTGVSAAIRNLRRRSGGMLMTALIVISIILFFMFLTAFIFALSVYGVIDTIVENARIRKASDKEKPER